MKTNMDYEELRNSMTVQDAARVLKETNCCGTMDIAKNVILEALEAQPRWIPVTERLPLLGDIYKMSDDVLITNGYAIYIGYLVDEEGKILWHFYDPEFEVDIKDEDNDVIAWMSLPLPCKTESEAKE